MEAFSASHVLALQPTYDFSRHRRVPDLGGGTGSFLKALLKRYPELQRTLYELSAAADVARLTCTVVPESEIRPTRNCLGKRSYGRHLQSFHTVDKFSSRKAFLHRSLPPIESPTR